MTQPIQDTSSRRTQLFTCQRSDPASLLVLPALRDRYKRDNYTHSGDHVKRSKPLLNNFLPMARRRLNPTGVLIIGARPDLGGQTLWQSASVRSCAHQFGWPQRIR